MAELLRAAVAALEGALTAEQVTRLNWSGRMTEEYRDPAHETRLKAARAVLDAVGVGKAASQRAYGPQVVVVVGRDPGPRPAAERAAPAAIDAEVREMPGA